MVKVPAMVGAVVTVRFPPVVRLFRAIAPVPESVPAPAKIRVPEPGVTMPAPFTAKPDPAEMVSDVEGNGKFPAVPTVVVPRLSVVGTLVTGWLMFTTCPMEGGAPRLHVEFNVQSDVVPVVLFWPKTGVSAKKNSNR